VESQVLSLIMPRCELLDMFAHLSVRKFFLTNFTMVLLCFGIQDGIGKRVAMGKSFGSV
jgi:hypothetical protein